MIDKSIYDKPEHEKAKALLDYIQKGLGEVKMGLDNFVVVCEAFEALGVLNAVVDKNIKD